MNYSIFFSDLGFNFDVDLKSVPIMLEKNLTLSNALKGSVFYYKSPDNTNTSFYLLTTALDTDLIDEIRKYIWNKNDADLIFYYPQDNDRLDMLYAKYSPKVSFNESVLETFYPSQKDLFKIETIKRWQFDSGLFWLNYQKCIDKARFRGIDKELVATLKALKDNLSKTLSHLILHEVELAKVVQALIDRTLYIKFLDDNHIINSYFYDHYFQDATLDYGKLLKSHSNTDLNKLFKIIHEIFNNALFDQPTIDDKYLTPEVCNLIATSFNTEKTGQLRLFDFQFNVLPVEFISYIYEVFLSEKQKANGIYYTPKKLAQLIVDEVIVDDKIGSILDPSCGSGMFLIVGFQKLIEVSYRQKKEPENNIDKIRYRIKLLSENIFGIEKELTAQRFTLFSLSLQIFKDIPPEEIKFFIANELERNNKINIFKEFNFYNNIIHKNSLDVDNPVFKDKIFTYIVGNPPFFEIPNSKEYISEISFLNSYKAKSTNGDKINAQKIIGKSQISQCFFIKLKDWSNENTRFGFVSNSSNFYNDYSENFQQYFYTNYGIEKVYELSRVKNILFEKAKESVLSIIFTNHFKNNIIDYYPVDLGLFSEKPFELLIIQEDKAIQIEQKRLINKQTRLRDYLVGNEYDLAIISKIEFNKDQLNHYLDISKEYSSFEGLKRLSNNDLKKHYEVTGKITKETLEALHNEFSALKYLTKEKDDYHNTPFLFKPESTIQPYKITDISGYMNENDCNKENFQRERNIYIYKGENIIINRFGTGIQAAFSNEDLFFSNLIYGIKLQNKQLYPLFLSILNSQLVNFYINLKFRLRADGNFSNITTGVIKSIPIPKELNKNLVTQISNLSKDLTDGKFEYSDKEEELNELIYDLYDLSYIQRQRIKDYFLPDGKKTATKSVIRNYEKALLDTLELYFSQKINIQNFNQFNLRVIKVSFGTEDNPSAKEVGLFTLEQIFKGYEHGKFFLDQEFVFGDKCIYILKKDINQNWTETKAFEDGQRILKLIPYEQ